MKNLALGLVGLLVLAVVAVAGLASTKPSQITFDRSVTIAATTADVAPLLVDLKGVVAWSPWTEKDPGLEQSWSETTSKVGDWYAWVGDDDLVGSGKQSITRLASFAAECEVFEITLSRGYSENSFRDDLKVSQIMWLARSVQQLALTSDCLNLAL